MVCPVVCWVALKHTLELQISTVRGLGQILLFLGLRQYGEQLLVGIADASGQGPMMMRPPNFAPGNMQPGYQFPVMPGQYVAAYATGSPVGMQQGGPRGPAPPFGMPHQQGPPFVPMPMNAAMGVPSMPVQYDQPPGSRGGHNKPGN